MKRVCITGATGFVGSRLLDHLSKDSDIELVALSRHVPPVMDGAKKGNVTWRRCNGFSLIDVEKVTEGVDTLVYLIHSMLPATTLSQGSFAEFDLYLADNFARAARKNGVKNIIYLSGIIPTDTNLSEHLSSRLEVEQALGQYGNTSISLRAGLIVGRRGSSFRILERLIRRIPILICPKWTLTRCQPIDIKDVLATIEHFISSPQSSSKVYDIGGPDVLTYRDMLRKTAKILDKKRLFINVNFITRSLSKMWVAKITSTSSELVFPLVDSLAHDMIVDPEKKFVLENHKYKSFEDSLRSGISPSKGGWFRIIINYSANITLHWLENVSSIQRIYGAGKLTAEQAAKVYFDWLPIYLRPLIQVKVDEENVYFRVLKYFTLIHLRKSIDRSSKERVVYYILGGLLARQSTMNGRLEFRQISNPESIIIALLDFRPSLPWFVYKYTQALFHLFVMKSFMRYLNKKKHSLVQVAARDNHQ